MMVLGGMMVQGDDISAFLNPFSSARNFRLASRRLARYVLDRLHYPRGTEVAHGNSLVARFFYSLKARNAVIWTGSPLVELVRKGRVCGAVVDRNGKKTRVYAKRGVFLATGGFPGSSNFRKTLAARYPHSHTLAFKGNIGDGLQAATAVGASFDTDLVSPGVWMPASIFKGKNGEEEVVFYGWISRGRPGVIAINPDGRRFVNESNSYHDIIMAMYRHGGGNDPRFYFVCDRNFVRKYGLGMLRPWPWTFSLRRYLKSEYITAADTLRELGKKIGVDPDNLLDTVRRHNDYAATGVDLEFGRGTNAFNRSLGDPSVGPNPNLAPIRKPPFIALRIVAATLGTAVGLKSDGDGRVLDDAGAPIPGLYAGGNDISSAMRGFYPSVGMMLGPAIVFAYRAVQHSMAQQ
jgi:3-oxosteroid 1-dehydrogenase